MFFIYSIDPATLDLQIYDFARSNDSIETLLRNAAVAFVRNEEGEKKAETAFKTDIPDDKLDVVGYFLRQSKSTPLEIELWHRAVTITSGWTGQRVSVKCEKKRLFRVVESNINLPTEVVGFSQTRPTFKSNQSMSLNDKLITELKEKLNNRNAARAILPAKPLPPVPTATLAPLAPVVITIPVTPTENPIEIPSIVIEDTVEASTTTDKIAEPIFETKVAVDETTVNVENPFDIEWPEIENPFAADYEKITVNTCTDNGEENSDRKALPVPIVYASDSDSDESDSSRNSNSSTDDDSDSDSDSDSEIDSDTTVYTPMPKVPTMTEFHTSPAAPANSPVFITPLVFTQAFSDLPEFTPTNNCFKFPKPVSAGRRRPNVKTISAARAARKIPGTITQPGPRRYNTRSWKRAGNGYKSD